MDTCLSLGRREHILLKQDLPSTQMKTGDEAFMIPLGTGTHPSTQELIFTIIQKLKFTSSSMLTII